MAAASTSAHTAMAMKSSPDAAALADQFLGAEQETPGILGSIKKIFGM